MPIGLDIDKRIADTANLDKPAKSLGLAIDTLCLITLIQQRDGISFGSAAGILRSPLDKGDRNPLVTKLELGDLVRNVRNIREVNVRSVRLFLLALKRLNTGIVVDEILALLPILLEVRHDFLQHLDDVVSGYFPFVRENLTPATVVV